MRAYSCTHVIKQVDSGVTVTCIQVACLEQWVTQSGTKGRQGSYRQQMSRKLRGDSKTPQSRSTKAVIWIACSLFTVPTWLSNSKSAPMSPTGDHLRPGHTGNNLFAGQERSTARNWLRQRKRCSDVHRWCALVCSDVMHVESGTHL